MTDFLLYLYAESPVHTGAADSAGVLDLPVQRESTTKYPVIWGQSLKGALRQAASEAPDAVWGAARVSAVFGSEIADQGADGGTNPGTLRVGDAQLVAMPVPTLRRTFAWLTSETAISRLARKYKMLRRQVHGLPRVAEDRAAAASPAWTGNEVMGPCLVPMDPYSENLASWAGQVADDVLGWDEVFATFADKLRQDLVLAGPELVSVLLQECTEQSVRVQLGDTKTVKNGPFYSEYLPAETIMAAVLTLRKPGDTPENRAALRSLLDKNMVQVGGDETIGKGLMWSRLLEAGLS